MLGADRRAARSGCPTHPRIHLLVRRSLLPALIRARDHLVTLPQRRRLTKRGSAICLMILHFTAERGRVATFERETLIRTRLLMTVHRIRALAIATLAVPPLRGASTC